MTQSDKKQNLTEIVSLLRSAESIILQTSRETVDVATLIQLNTEYSALDSYLSQVLHALAISDDSLFESASSALKQQASVLQQNEDDINKIVKNIELAAKIAGTLAQAAKLATSL